MLDRLLLYLRIVHSIDYYNTCEYPSEDEMPNRCGMIHVRGPIPPNRIAHSEGQCGRSTVNILFSHTFSFFFYMRNYYFYSPTVAESNGGEAEPFV